MRLFIASDIHGSKYHCEKLMERYKVEKPDKILLLGDLLYHGPRNDLPEDYDTKATIAMLNEHKDSIIAVRGNCDAEVDQMVLEFPIMDTYQVIETDDLVLFATHGHVYNPGRLPPIEKLDVLMNGHTHISALENRGEYYYVNPGSTSIPKGGTRSSYLIYDNKTFELKDLEGNSLSKITIERG